MAWMSKSDLVYDDYSWTVYGDDDPKVEGQTDIKLLNRKQGYEILNFINTMANIHNFKYVSSGQKIEKMIRDHLPIDIQSQMTIKDWIEKNWTGY